MKQWYPDIEPSFMFFTIQNKALLVNYVLHAKHRSINTGGDKLTYVMGDTFQEIVEAASHFIN